MEEKFGVVTEQGFPIGQFGFKPITESEKEELEKSKKDKKDESEKGE